MCLISPTLIIQRPFQGSHLKIRELSSNQRKKPEALEFSQRIDFPLVGASSMAFDSIRFDGEFRHRKLLCINS